MVGSNYDDPEMIASSVAAGKHRSVIGGLWDEIGRLQFDFMVSQGLEPHHHLLDIGCGSLRGGVHFIGYLDSGNYFGIDSNQSLIDAGLSIESKVYGLEAKVRSENFSRTDNFDFSFLDMKIDFAIAQSVFTHIDLNKIRLCLFRLKNCLTIGGKLFATYFELAEENDLDQEIHRFGDTYTAFNRDPYHYYFEDLVNAARNLPYRVTYIGDWEHPRGQFMIEFERIAHP